MSGDFSESIANKKIAIIFATQKYHRLFPILASVILQSILTMNQANAASLEDFLESVTKGHPNGVTLTSDEMNSLTKKSLELVEKKEYRDALTILVRKMKNLRTPNPSLLAALANTLLAAGKIEDAATIADKAHELKPDYDWPLIISANAYIKLQKFTEAKIRIITLKELGETPDVMILKGDWYRAQQRYIDAETNYREATKLRPDSEDLRALRFWNLETAINYGFENKNYAALSKLLQGVEKSAPNFDVYKYLGKISEIQDARNEADEYYATSFKKFPSGETKDRLYEFRLQEARRQFSEQNYSETMRWSNLAGAIKKTPEIRAIQGDCYRMMGEYTKAENFYKKAAPMSEGRSTMLEARAWNFTLLGSAKEAEDALLEAVKESPEDPRFLVALALHYKRQDRIVEAIQALARAKALCVSKEANDRYSELFPLDFFDYSSASGAALDGLGVPVSLSAFVEVGHRLSNVEGATRGLALQNISADNYERYLPVRMTGYSDSTMRANIYSPTLPLMTLTIREMGASEPRNQQDPTLNQKSRQASLESTSWSQIGKRTRLGISPFVRFTSYSGISPNNETIYGSDYQTTESAIGTRLRLQPINGGFVFDSTFVGAQNKDASAEKPFLTYSLDGHFYASPLKSLATDLEVNVFNSPSDPGSDGLIRTEYIGGAAFLFGDKSAWNVSIRQTKYQDKIDSRGTLVTQFTVPSTQLRLWPNELIGVELGVSRFMPQNYTAYEYNSYQGSFIFIPRWIKQRALLYSQQSTIQSVPIEMRLSYVSHKFPARGITKNSRISENEQLTGLTYGIRLFW